MSRFLVYLLCLEPRDPSSPRHYVGITTPPRLPKRMQEHRSGKGGLLTQALAASGLPWWFTNYWLTDDPGLEPYLRALPGLAGLCPRCTLGLTGAMQRPYPKEKGEQAPVVGSSFPLSQKGGQS